MAKEGIEDLENCKTVFNYLLNTRVNQPGFIQKRLFIQNQSYSEPELFTLR